MIEEKKRIRSSKQIIENLLGELRYNYDLAIKLRQTIKLPKSHLISASSPHGIGIEVFDLFQINGWHLLSPKLELDDVGILYELSVLYHRLEFFNEAMKIESVGERRLSSLLRKEPSFLDNAQEDLKKMIKKLESF